MANSKQAEKRIPGEVAGFSMAEAPKISLPKGGGAIRGIGEKFAANPVTGSGSITVPIATSAGRSGFGPSLALTYDSGAGNGPFGLGWSLGIPAITRKMDKGLPQYRDWEESDVFILSGAEDLVPIIGTGGAVNDTFREGFRVVRYRPRIEGLFARIERWTRISDGDTHWRSISSDNVTTLYGKDSESRISDPQDSTRVFSWLICQSYEGKGNAIAYEYQSESSDGVDDSLPNERNRRNGPGEPDLRSANRYLKRIRYGNQSSIVAGGSPVPVLGPDLSVAKWLFEVVFDYGEGHFEPGPLAAQKQQFVRAGVNAAAPKGPVRADPFSTYRAGFEVRTYRLCRRVLMFHHFPAELGIDDCLVHATEFHYRESPIATSLVELVSSGYVRQPTAEQADRYLQRSLPALKFVYSEPPTPSQLAMQPIREVDQDSLENLPDGLDGTLYQWVDLNGDGLPGIFTEQAEGWFYKRNLTPLNNVDPDKPSAYLAAKFAPVEIVRSRPAASLARRAQFLDLAGDGQPDLVLMEGPVRGFYERSWETDWEPFRAFQSWPNIDPTDPNLKFIDLDGDGRADILITKDETFTWYPSLAEEGFGAALRARQPWDEEKGPRLVFADSEQSIFLADLSGDGLTDLVRIRNQEVCYWPNLGYGLFGAKIAMDNAPRFDVPDEFDQKRIRLADIDGSGTTDIIYLHRDEVRIYFNESGNRCSDAVPLPQFPPIDNVSSIQAVDLLGNGTACLVWSSPLAAQACHPMRYLELMSQKPHLLVKMTNNLGAETVVSYAPSTRFYLQDKRDGKPWVTRLPFPVQVVERVETYDRISGSRFVSRSSYHHGYFDGVEREFRGFGRVETLDTEEIATVASEEASSVVTNLDVVSQVPPIRTRTWFHTGAYRQGDKISRHLEDEYYGAPQPGEPNFAAKRRTFEATLLDDTVLPSGLTLNEEREACRALKGVMLRQEIYAEDAPEGASEERAERAKIPYTVTEQNFTVERVQVRSGDRDGVFVVHPRETLSYHYERQPEAPRIGHALTLEVDSYGNALRTMAISYGRTSSLLTEPADQEKQTQTLITYTENRVTKPIDDAAHPDDYHTPLAAETFTYELTGLKPETNGVRFSFDEFTRNNFAALNSVQEIQYEERADSITKQKRLIERIRTLYRKDDLTALLTVGDLDPLTLPGESYKLALTPGLLAQTYKRTVGPGPEEDLLPIPKVVLGGNGPDTGGYVDLDANGHWWIPSGRVFFDAAADIVNPSSTAVTELAEAQKHFYVTRLLADPFTHRGRIDYDPHDLLVVRTEDALQNSVAANYDYRVLQPQLTSDPNGNRSAAAYDALGMVVATALMGKAAPAPAEGDLLEGFDPDPPLAALQTFTTDPLAHADSLLGKATARLVYDLERFQRCGQPPFSSSLVRETHFSEAAGAVPMIQVSFSYSDGFGREIQKKIQAEPGPAPRRASMVPLPLGDMAPGALLRDVAGQVTSAPTPLRWVGTGRTVFNNKGKPVRQYEPFFSSTHLFEAEREMTDTGVTPILFYDPAERLVATVHPDHSWEKVVFDGWEQTVYDVNDTLLQADGTTDPKFDKDVQGFFSRLSDADYLPTWLEQRRSLAADDPERLAAEKATVHRQTPATSHLDVLGRPFLTIARNRFVRGGRVIEESYASRVELDIEGHQRAVRDAIEQNGDRLGRLVMRYDYNMLGHLIRQASMEAGERWMLSDVTGKAIRAWDSRGFARRIAYDELRRAIGLFVAQNGTERLAERTLYGEGEGTATNHRTRVHQAFDGAGVVTSEAYDFKGNLLRSRRELLPDYKEAVDWKLDPTPNAGLFRTSKTYDALNRPVTVTSPDGSLYRPAFNEANLLNKVEVNLRGAAAVTPFVTNIDYDAKGRRELIAYGNGAVTTYQYDPLTLRLIQLETRRPAGLNGLASKLFNDGAVVQDLHYTYDPAGNITRITDSSLARLSAAGPADNAPRDYTYDALYRLIEATGREHTGQTARVFAPPDGNFRDYPFSGLANYIAHPNDLQAIRLYTEKYEYDAAGNFQFMRHVAESGNWSRSYQYQAASLTEPTKRSNRLTKSIIGNGATFDETYDYADSSGLDTPGCMTAINNLRMTWDDKDQLHKVDLGGGGTAYYVFDGTGQRTRKVIETAVGTRAHERIYLGGFEIYREYDALGTTIELERESLHLMDDQQRVALVETKTRDAGVPIATPLSLVRYQIGNHLGSSSLELDASGAIISYEEYFCYGSSSLQAGRTAAEASLKRYRFTGKERDEETGFSYHRARFLAPWLGRWVSSDPSGLEDGLNVFSYARNNPVILSDPDGRQSRVDPNDPRVKALAAATPRRQSLQADAGRKGPLQSFHLKGAHKGTPGGAGNAHQPSAPKKEGKPGGTDAVTKAGEASGNSDHSRDGKAEPPKSGTGETKAGGSKTNLVGGHGDLQNQTAAKTELDYAALLAGYINFEFGSEKGGVQSGGIPGGKGEDKNASPAGQSLYAALALLDLIGAAKAIYGVGKAILKHTIGTIGARIAGDRALREGLKELTEAEARRLAAQQVAKKASVPIEKFSEYIFKEGADHGKDAVFRGLGYGKEHSAQLAKIWEEQGAEKFAKGEYTLGKLDQYGQRINISIEVPGIGDAAGKTSYMQSGWMIRPDGSITLNTPFSGFTK